MFYPFGFLYLLACLNDLSDTIRLSNDTDLMMKKWHTAYALLADNPLSEIAYGKLPAQLKLGTIPLWLREKKSCYKRCCINMVTEAKLLISNSNDKEFVDGLWDPEMRKTTKPVLI